MIGAPYLLLVPLCVMLAGCPRLTRPANFDPLDTVTGTESWRVAPESISEEWRDWYRARVAWRRDHRELRVQRVRSVRIAGLVERFPEGPSIEEVRQVLMSRATRAPAAPAPGPGDDGAAAPRDPGSQPPSWIKVPVEKLDDKGQALDEERPKRQQ